MKNKGLILLSTFLITVSTLDVSHALDKKSSPKQPQKKTQEAKPNVVANEILKSLEVGNRNPTCAKIILVRQGNGGSQPNEYKTITFNSTDYFLVNNVSITKVGATVRKREVNPFTKVWEEEYSAPILITVQGSCTAGPKKGQVLTIEAKEKIVQDEWNEWHWNGKTLNWPPSDACSEILVSCTSLMDEQKRSNEESEKKQMQAQAEREKIENKRKEEQAEQERIRQIKQDVNKHGEAANTYFKNGQYQRAVEEYDAAIKIMPDASKIYYNRGQAYGMLGQYQPAVEDFNEAIRLQIDFVDAYNSRGLAYLSQGNKDLGCVDAKYACKLGDCSTLKWARSQGLFGWCLGN